MKEDYLHLLWKTKRLPFHILQTIDNKAVRILHVGIHNLDAGPDFFNSQIELDGLKQNGNVEMHIKSSDWYAHGHQNDSAYNNVILHVVYEHDQLVFIEGFPIPTIELKQHIDWKHFNQFHSVSSTRPKFPCQSQFKSVDPMVFWRQVQKALLLRLNRKTSDLKQALNSDSDFNPKKALLVAIAKSFGMKTNALPFVQLAQQIPLERFFQASLFEKEAIVFGLAGFLEEKKDVFQTELQTEWLFQRYKNNLHPMNKFSWKFKGCRPNGFPTLRLAQFTQFVHLLDWNQAFWEEMVTKLNSDLLKGLSLPLHEYWKEHYDFGKKRTSLGSASMSKRTAQTIIANSFIPFLELSSAQYNLSQTGKISIDWLSILAPESNSIIHGWNAYARPPKHAGEAQGLIEMTNEFCSKKQCLKCDVGKTLFQVD